MRWKKNGWKTINGTEVQNKAEFQKLSKLCDEVDVKWVSYRKVFLNWEINGRPVGFHTNLCYCLDPGWKKLY